MKIIVAVDANWAIGKNNELLFHIPEDLANFKRITQGHIVVMGRKTLESLPNGKPLGERLNIVLTRQNLVDQDNLMVCHSIRDLFIYLKGRSEEVFIIGGAEIYKQLIDYCHEALVTKVDIKAPEPDAFFPNLDKLSNWKLVEESGAHYYKELTYRFTKYQNNQVKEIN